MTTIEVFADVRCPFTHLGLRRVIEHRDAAGRGDLRLRVRSWPLELVNGEPLAPDLIEDEVHELRTQIAPDLFTGYRRDRFSTTSLPALELAATAYAASLEAGERVSLALRWSLFEEGRDIADPHVLAAAARSAGVPVVAADARARVLADWAEGQERGVVGSPHFFVGETGFFCPSLDISRDAEGQLHIAIDESVFDDFLQRCFAAAPA